jgi:hypothetical protein
MLKRAGHGRTRRTFLTASPSPQLSGGLFGHIPAGRHQDGWTALQDARQCFGPFDTQIDGIVFDG